MDAAKTSFSLKSLTAALLLWALLLHGLFLVSAGALWRDEANSVNQAAAASWTGLWESLRYDSFPALYAALLRILLPGSPSSSTSPLRMMGVAVGIALLVSLWQVGRMLGSRFPVILLALLAIDPVFISEGDSIRPYGIGLLCVLWSYCAYAKLMLKPSLSWLMVASIFSVLAVQAGYTAAIFIGALALSAGIAVLASHSRGMLWRILLPGFLASLSLAPYIHTLQESREWISVLHYEVNWGEYLRGYLHTHSAASFIAWLAAASLGVYSVLRICDRGVDNPEGALNVYSSLAAATGVIAQVLFVQMMGIPTFPRYFLPGLLLAGLGLEVLTRDLRPSIRAVTALFVMLVTAWPAWSWVRLRHSNVDLVARALDDNAKPVDLVIISPWFLHPSFQLYYRGQASWATVPDLPHQSLTRYDLVREAMTDPEREQRLQKRMKQALSNGGAIWFVSQSFPERPAEMVLPAAPVFTVRPGGGDYVRFRSYWERTIIFRLYDCCKPVEWLLPRSGPVWQEENLVLTRWQLDGGNRANK